MIAVFHPDAPGTVKLGAIGVALLAVLDIARHVRWLRAVPIGESIFWAGLLRVGVTLGVGLCLAWGIARLNRGLYLSWFAISLLFAGVEIALPAWHLISLSPDIGAIAVGPQAVIMSLLWLVTAALLVTPASVRAFRHHAARQTAE